MNNVLTGAAMGAALTTAGVYAPDIILSQFKFTDFTMLQTFLTAAAGSTLLVTAAQALHLTDLPPRGPSSLGLCGRYDGNLVGGALLGAGMAISGACPGTVLAQLGVGVSSGRYALGGAVAAGVAWSWIRRRRAPGSGCPGSAPAPAPPSAVADGKEEGGVVSSGKGDHRHQTGAARKDGRGETVYELLGISRGALLVGLEAGLVLAVAAAVRYTRADAAEARGLPPYYAGLAIAAAQLVSIVLRGSLLGASAAFEELGGWLWGVREYSNVLFSAGVVGGAWLVSRAVPALRPVTEVAIPPLRSALGGFMIVFGSRMAGGCTSGHGISGLSLMSNSSFLTAAAIFGAGGLTGLLLG
ncbi:hypothetical protein MYCTH_2309910 [Thermothelomyces thermophilus ATCC 42464]|uniref:Uncharacterized protein n=1 Tax=Thermothelomyces thermophilus (strain ATCC 42464 / BCRC 31852 / DSM 1799) TaxID=573729 RepID=G2QKU8_THET4|nr:uncharacterized protein MYCTH_2309910 [Thermothelomyces thermophilus ATCC 42464]AEO60580.1 hypothetical protein MYCTH_2309910 [Thermothelomyces thermophilus ATCC 42464]